MEVALAFEINKSTISLCTETWFQKNDKQLKKMLEEAEQKDNVRFIRRDRDSRGGGVAIAFSTDRGDFKNCLLYTSPSPRD